MKFLTSSSFFNVSAVFIFLFSSSTVTISVCKFLQFTNHHIRVEVTGKRGNRGVELVLEIPVNYFFVENIGYNMGERCVKKLDNEPHVKVKKCVK